MRRIPFISSLGLLLLAGPAWAHHNPGYWYLDEVIHGEFDGYEGSVGNTVNYIEVDPATGTGEMELSACCNFEDCEGSGSNIYLLTWEVVPNASSASRGQTFEVHLTNQLIGGVGCAEIDPFVSTCGQDGAPSSQEGEQGVVLDYRSNPLTHAECNRFYTDPASSSFHVPSPHEVYFYGHENMPHDGYFWLNITQRWGMQYEIVWIYREDVTLTGGPPTGGAGGESSGGAAGTSGTGGSDDLGDAGIDPGEVGGSANGGSGNGAAGNPPGSNNDQDGGNTLTPTNNDSADGGARRGGGGGGCGMITPTSRTGTALTTLLALAALVGRRRRAR